MRIIQSFIFCLLACMVISACQNKTQQKSRGENSIYYWRTTFSLSDREKEFLRTHDVNKIYMRFFDVTSQYMPADGEAAMPDATIRFNDTVPAGIEIIPTVYITIEAMKAMQMKETEYAEKILNRVKAICRHNGIKFNELQLDCDWTGSTRKHFFKLCEAVKHGLDSTQSLSSTIRLHQLTQAPPPVDRGVLMVYNTGNLMDITTGNSIFSLKDIEPYLRDNRLADYPLPLDVAYPAYGWSLVFSHSIGGEYNFDRIMRRTDLLSYPQLRMIIPDVYEATSTINLSEKDDYDDIIYNGDRVKIERPSAIEILKVKALIDNCLSGKNYKNILYHLDENQLLNYSDDEISEIYSHN